MFYVVGTSTCTLFVFSLHRTYMSIIYMFYGFVHVS